jgi:hypothetical protein
MFVESDLRTASSFRKKRTYRDLMEQSDPQESNLIHIIFSAE